MENKQKNSAEHNNSLTSKGLCTSNDPKHLPKPLTKQNLNNLPYIEKEVSLYSNMYRIKMTKHKTFFEYAVKFQHDEEFLSSQFKRKIFNKLKNEINLIYGTYIFTGDSLFGTKSMKEVKNYVSAYKQFKYSIIIQPTKERVDMTDNPEKLVKVYEEKKEVKTMIELMIKDILRHNPGLKYVTNLFGKRYSEEQVKAYNSYNSILIIPGFTTKVMILESGIYLNVDVKNKVLSKSHCLDLINSFVDNKSKVTRNEKEQINEFFNGKTIETLHTCQKFKIDMVNFEKRAKDHSIKFENSTISLIKFYKNIFGVNVDPNSPLLLIKTRGKNEQHRGIYYPPELCKMVGLTDEMKMDHNLLKQLSKFTKKKPEDKINSIHDIVQLVNEKKGITKVNKKTNQAYTLRSPYEMRVDYGVEIQESAPTSFKGCMMSSPEFLGRAQTPIRDIRKPFKIYKAEKINFLCVFHKQYAHVKDKFKQLANEAGESYGIKIGKSLYMQINSEDPNDWVNNIAKHYDENTYNIVFIILDDYFAFTLGHYDIFKEGITQIKGCQTQVLRTDSIFGKNSMSIMTNILIQANNKVGGISYKINFGLEISNKKLMIVGIDSSKSGSDKTLVAMTATIDKDFNYVTNKKIEISSVNCNTNLLPVSCFIYEAINEYFKRNRELPGGVIIYRQGVSREQKRLLEPEVGQVENLLSCNDENFNLKQKIPYYYILVNKKTSLKFFETETSRGRLGILNQYENPNSGLLVCDSLCDPEFFEFFIQPQKVTQGTATPSCFHVMYGNLNCPKLIPKLTYDLCHLYCNWRGPVRVPAPLKYAEKYAKTNFILNTKLKSTLGFI